jgi:arginine utilization protein RocB
LSYTGYQLSQAWSGIAREMPGWGSAYSLPLQTMAELSIPVCNLGPYGKDAHQWTERLDVDYATRVLPALSMAVIEQAWSGCRQ